jgi:uncharacterized RDD family membrane protein YckC
MAQDDFSGSGRTEPNDIPPDLAPGSATPLGGTGEPPSEPPQPLPPTQTLPPFQGFTSLPPASVAGSPPEVAAPGFPPTPGYMPPYVPPYVPPFGAPYAPPPYSPPPFGSPPYGQAPGYLPYVPPQHPASGWQALQQGSWGAPGYAPAGWPYQPGYAPVVYAPPGPAPGWLWGGIGERFAALLIDGMILFFSAMALGLIASAIGGPNASSASTSPATTATSLIWLFLALIYHPACWWVFGATPGQKALGLTVAQASNGQSLGIGAVLARFLIFFIVTIIVPLGLISAAMASSDPFKRAWHDQVARSIVVKSQG